MPFQGNALVRRLKRNGSVRAFEEEPVLVPVTLADRELVLVVGMQWHTILGSDLPAQARRKAREVGARHWVHAGGRAESVGTANLVSGRAGRRDRLPKEAHSAAQIVALRHPSGIHALVLPLPDTRYWVVIARDGQVTARGDRVFNTCAEVEIFLDEARGRFGAELRLWGRGASVAHQAGRGGHPPEAIGSGDDEFLSLAQDAGPRSLLRSGTVAPRGRGVLAVAVLLGLALFFILNQLKQGRAVAHSVPEAGRQSISSQEIARMWRHATSDWLHEAGAPSHAGMQRLWQRVTELPVVHEGWWLDSFRCREQGIPWRCEARYSRAGRYATAAGFLAAAPAEWQVRWEGFDEAMVTFDISVERHGLSLSRLESTTAGLIPDADALQSIRPLLRSIHVSEARTVALPAPRDANGQALARPSSVPGLVARDITLQAPLRSFSLLGPDLNQRIAWHELSVQLQRHVEPSITASVLMATLRGKSFDTEM